MKSEDERAKYIKSVNDAYESSIRLLDKNKEMGAMDAAVGGEDKTSEHRHGHHQLRRVLPQLLLAENVLNCALQVSCICSKIRAHYNALASDLANLHLENVTNVQRMAKDMALYKNSMWEYCNKQRSASRAFSKAYSMRIKQEGIKFPDLINRYTRGI